MTAGRPKITLEDLPPSWETDMHSLAEQGASETEIRIKALGGICHETYHRLLKEEPKFSESVRSCRDNTLVWWERAGRDLVTGSLQGNANAYSFQMKNRFGWKDKQEITGDPEHPIGVTGDINVRFVGTKDD